MKYLNGYYVVDGEISENKIYSMIRSTEKRMPLSWCYFDNIFDDALKVDHETLSLQEVYKTRAQQLRDSYDYLILNYSGGSDSHNILCTFLVNNIPLDCVYVQWPETLMDKGIYTPNAIDKSNGNFHSEWDFVLKKDLEWLALKHPEIKIEISDWTNKVNEFFYNDDLFLKNVSNLPSIARSIKQNTFSEIESTLANQGKKVASIFGVDKPNIVKKGDDWFFYFTDTSFMTQANPENPSGTEYFYNTPLYPELTIIQAKKMVEWYKRHPEKQYLIQSRSERSTNDLTFNNWSYERHYQEWAEQAEIAKLVCYPFWDFNRFQAAKPFSTLENLPMGVRQWDNILTVIPGFKRVQQKWEHNWKSYLSLIDKSLMRSHDTVSVCRSKWFYIGR